MYGDYYHLLDPTDSETGRGQAKLNRVCNDIEVSCHITDVEWISKIRCLHLLIPMRLIFPEKSITPTHDTAQKDDNLLASPRTEENIFVLSLPRHL